MIPIFLDTETTDNTSEARLVQLCFKKGLENDPHVAYFKPPVPISYHAMAVCHITNEQVQDKEVFENSESEKLLRETLKDNCLVAHNAKFDVKVLKNEGLSVPFYICTLQVARHLIESESYQLQYLRYFLKLNVQGGAHDAADDVATLQQLYLYLKEILYTELGNDSSEEKVLQRMHELTFKPVLIKTFRFGKHKGKSIEIVAKIDPGYIDWLLNSEVKKMSPERDEDLIFTLRNYHFKNL